MRLIEKMEADVSGQVEEILGAAKKTAAGIEGEAKAKIEQLAKAARLFSTKRVELDKARNSSNILQDIKREEAELKRDLVEQVFTTAQKQLEELPSSDYEKLFVTLASEAFTDLNCKVRVAVREGDKKRAEAAVKEAGADAEVHEDLDGQGGGLTLTSEDGELFVDNTIATRLERSRIDGVTVAGNILFGGKAVASTSDDDSEADEAEAEPKKKSSTKKKKSKKK